MLFLVSTTQSPLNPCQSYGKEETQRDLGPDIRCAQALKPPLKWCHWGSRLEEIRSYRKVISETKKRFLSKPCSHFLRIPPVFQDLFVFAGLSLPVHSQVHSWAMNYWCPFSRAHVGTRWCIALGLAGAAKLNFNVSEQLNDWGLIQTHFSHWSEDTEAELSQTEQNCCSLRGSCTFCTHILSKPQHRGFNLVLALVF